MDPWVTMNINNPIMQYTGTPPTSNARGSTVRPPPGLEHVQPIPWYDRDFGTDIGTNNAIEDTVSGIEPSSQTMATISIPAFAEDQVHYGGGALPWIEPNAAAMSIQQQAYLLPHPATGLLTNPQSRGNQLVDVLSPVVNNLHTTGAFMGQMRENEEIDDIRRQHFERARDLIPLMTRPTGEPVVYYRLRTSDPYLINSAARLQERHLQMAHDLRIIHSTDEMIQRLTIYRESALRRMRGVDLDYGAIVEQLVEFVQGQPTVQGSVE